MICINPNCFFKKHGCINLFILLSKNIYSMILNKKLLHDKLKNIIFNFECDPGDIIKYCITRIKNKRNLYFSSNKETELIIEQNNYLLFVNQG